MIKEKRIRNIYIFIFIIMLCVLFFSFFSVKTVYASVLNETFTVDELFDMFNIDEEERINPWDYGFERFIATTYNKSTLSEQLNFIFFNEEMDFNRISTEGTSVYYTFDEDILVAEYVNGMFIRDIGYDSPSKKAIGTVPFYDTIYDDEVAGFKLIYSSHNLYRPDGTLFFSAAKKPRMLVPITKNLGPGMAKALGEVVSLIPIGVGLVVSFLALRKALRMLLQILRQA